MKKVLLMHPLLSVIPFIFFIVFLHPFYLVEMFEKNIIGLLVFKLLVGCVVLVGFAGFTLYLKEWIENLKKKNLKSPKLWFLLPVNVVSLIICIQFLLMNVLLG